MVAAAAAEPAAMVGKALPYRLLCSGEAHGTREPSRSSMLMEVGVRRENGEQVLSDLLDDRVRKDDVNRMRTLNNPAGVSRWL